MKTTEIKTIKIEADEGKILTDGESYGRTIYLAKNRLPEEFHEITEAEYEEIQKQNKAEANNI